MATVEEVKITGRAYRIWDAVNSIWKRISYWTKESDVEFEDGLNLEDKVDEINNNFDGKINALDFSDPSASGTTITAIDTVSQTNGKINATKKTIRSATASQTGVVKLSDNYTSSAGTAAQSVGASSKAVSDAYTTLNSNKINKSNLTFTLSGSDLYITKTY